VSDPAIRSMIAFALTDLVWKKGSRSSASGCCVECLALDDLVLIRDSKYRRDGLKPAAEEPVIVLGRDTWNAFMADLESNSGRSHNGAVRIETEATGTRLASVDGVVLEYTVEEWRAFLAGVLDGEFVDL
jgi:hypothetical protein